MCVGVWGGGEPCVGKNTNCWQGSWRLYSEAVLSVGQLEERRHKVCLLTLFSGRHRWADMESFLPKSSSSSSSSSSFFWFWTLSIFLFCSSVFQSSLDYGSSWNSQNMLIDGTGSTAQQPNLMDQMCLISSVSLRSLNCLFITTSLPDGSIGSVFLLYIFFYISFILFFFAKIPIPSWTHSKHLCHGTEKSYIFVWINARSMFKANQNSTSYVITEDLIPKVICCWDFLG